MHRYLSTKVMLAVSTGLLWSLLSCGEASCAAALEAAAAAIDITPDEGEVLDPLHARVLVFVQGDVKAAIVSCDMIGVSPEITANVRQIVATNTGIPGENVLVVATHTHNGRVAHPQLVERIAAAAAQAARQVRPVELLAATLRQQETLSFNRRYLMKDGTIRFNPGPLNPDIVRPVGPIDPDIGAVYLHHGGGEPAAALVAFALHACTVNRPGWSADYPGYLEQSLRDEWGPSLVCLFGAGPCGDVNHFDVSRPRAGSTHFRGQTFLIPYEPIATEREPSKLTTEYIGRALGKTVKAGLKAALPVSPSLAVGRTTVDVPLATYSAMDLAWARQAVKEDISFLASVRATRILALETLRKQGDTVPLEVWALRLGGDAALVALPGEIFVELGLDLKKRSPFSTTLVVELAGSSRINYVPTRKAFVEGEYEVVNSRLECGGGEMLVDAAVALLAKLHSGH